MAVGPTSRLPLQPDPDFVGTRKGILNPETLTLEERNALIKENPAYGNIICRCEMVTEGEPSRVLRSGQLFLKGVETESVVDALV